MGQQQLLLLVLSTVIVGLATVAGIQAFSENQAQASQDALVQRATSVASDIKGLQGRPVQMGGIDLTASSNKGYSGADDIADAIGLDNNPFKASGAGSGALCEVLDTPNATSGDNRASIQCSSPDAAQDVEVVYNAQADEVSTHFSTGNTVTSP